MQSLIRRAAQGDASVLSDIGGRTFADTFGHLYDPKDLQKFRAKSHSVEAYAKILSDPAQGVWIAEDGEGHPLGYCAAGPCVIDFPGLAPGAGEIIRLYVVEEAKGVGVAAALMEAALEFLKARHDVIYLSVYSENPRAQRFYQRYGFVKKHDYFYMVGDQADPEWIMELIVR